MTERKKDGLIVLGTVAKVGLAGFAWGVLGGIGLIWLNHRERTHHSVKVHPILEKVIDFDQRTIGLDSRIWAGAHRIHHEWPDVSVGPFARIAQAVNWMKVNPEKTGGTVLPETISNLDPYVDEIKLNDVVEIGNLALEVLKERMGEKYRPPENYIPQQLEELLNPKEPQYWYPKEKPTGEFTQDEIADILLRDPHSPVLVRKPNGVRFILTGNTGQYKRITHLFETHPELMPEDLQEEDGKVKKYGNSDIALGFAIPSVAILMAKGEYTPRGVLKAVVAGTAANLIRIGLMVFGGRAVNSLGHAGVMTEGVIKVLQGKEYKPKLYPDGTIATDPSKNSLLDLVLIGMTLDEVNQREHHEEPGRIAYTSEKGRRAWRRAPLGSLTSALAGSPYFPFINTGDNFNLEPGVRRLDQAHPAVEMIQDLRAEQLAAR